MSIIEKKNQQTRLCHRKIRISYRHTEVNFFFFVNFISYIYLFCKTLNLTRYKVNTYRYSLCNVKDCYSLLNIIMLLPLRKKTIKGLLESSYHHHFLEQRLITVRRLILLLIDRFPDDRLTSNFI